MFKYTSDGKILLSFNNFQLFNYSTDRQKIFVQYVPIYPSYISEKTLETSFSTVL